MRMKNLISAKDSPSINSLFFKITLSCCFHFKWLHLCSLHFVQLATKLCPEDVTATDFTKVKCYLLQIAFPVLQRLVNSAWEHFPKAAVCLFYDNP